MILKQKHDESAIEGATLTVTPLFTTLNRI